MHVSQTSLNASAHPRIRCWFNILNDVIGSVCIHMVLNNNCTMSICLIVSSSIALIRGSVWHLFCEILFTAFHGCVYYVLSRLQVWGSAAFVQSGRIWTGNAVRGLRGFWKGDNGLKVATLTCLRGEDIAENFQLSEWRFNSGWRWARKVYQRTRDPWAGHTELAWDQLCTFLSVRSLENRLNSFDPSLIFHSNVFTKPFWFC